VTLLWAKAARQQAEQAKQQPRHRLCLLRAATKAAWRTQRDTASVRDSAEAAAAPRRQRNDVTEPQHRSSRRIGGSKSHWKRICSQLSDPNRACWLEHSCEVRGIVTEELKPKRGGRARTAPRCSSSGERSRERKPATAGRARDVCSPRKTAKRLSATHHSRLERLCRAARPLSTAARFMASSAEAAVANGEEGSRRLLAQDEVSNCQTLLNRALALWSGAGA